MSYFSNLSRRKFIWGMSCTCGVSLILPSCADVAMSDRKQIKIFSDDFLYSKTFPAYENLSSPGQTEDLNYSFLAKLFAGISDQQKEKIFQVLKNTRILEKTG